MSGSTGGAPPRRHILAATRAHRTSHPRIRTARGASGWTLPNITRADIDDALGSWRLCRPSHGMLCRA